MYNWFAGNLLSDDSDDADSDVNMNQDTSSDDESLTNESVSDSSNDRIPIIKRSKVSASTSAGISLFFFNFFTKFL